MSRERWRTGRKLGRTLYLDDEVVGMIDTPELAAEIVAAMNALEADEDFEEADPEVETVPATDIFAAIGIRLDPKKCRMCGGCGQMQGAGRPHACEECGGTGKNLAPKKDEETVALVGTNAAGTHPVGVFKRSELEGKTITVGKGDKPWEETWRLDSPGGDDLPIVLVGEDASDSGLFGEDAWPVRASDVARARLAAESPAMWRMIAKWQTAHHECLECGDGDGDNEHTEDCEFLRIAKAIGYR